MVQALASPYTGTVVYLLLFSIIAGVGFKSLLPGLRQSREQRVGWYRQPMIMAGIAFLLMSAGQTPNILVPIYERRMRLSYSTETLLNVIANASVLFFFAIVLYLMILEVMSRRLLGDNEQSDEEIENGE